LHSHTPKAPTTPLSTSTHPSFGCVRVSVCLPACLSVCVCALSAEDNLIILFVLSARYGTAAATTTTTATPHQQQQQQQQQHSPPSATAAPTTTTTTRSTTAIQ